MSDASKEAVERHINRIDPHGYSQPKSLNADTIHMLRALAAELENLRAQLDARVTVKPLVWEYHPCGSIAAPPTGHAYIIDTRMKGRCYSVKGFNPQREFASIEAAKDAAQADYERRILEALTFTPQPSPEAVARAAGVACLQCIADLPTGHSEDVMEGQEQGYRAIEKMVDNPEAIATIIKEAENKP